MLVAYCPSKGAAEFIGREKDSYQILSPSPLQQGKFRRNYLLLGTGIRGFVITERPQKKVQFIESLFEQTGISMLRPAELGEYATMAKRNCRNFNFQLENP